MNKYKNIVKDYKEGFYTDKNQINQEIKNLKISFKNFCFADKFKKEMKSFNEKCEKYSKKYGNFLAVNDENLRIFVSANLTLFDFDEKEAKKEFANLKKEYDNIFNLENNYPFEWRFEFPEILDDDGNFQGFDLIIGNPPYIRQEEIKELKPNLAKNYKVYKGTSDIYTYFYELGFNILKSNGVLSFITSNKYTRAGYGEALREFLLKNVSILDYIDLNGIKVFDSATVDTSILSFEKLKSKDSSFRYLALDNENLKACGYSIDLCKDFKELSQKSLSKENFTFSDESTNSLKAKIERIGTPLKEWQGLNIYRGILTGYNEAFIISTEKRNEILENCKDEAEKERTAKLIRKMLRGRDIKRYSYEWAGLWIIGTFPSLKIDIEQYPALKQYLSQFLPRIEQSGEKGCRKKTSNKWFETQDNIAYYQEFEKEKIVWASVGHIEHSFIPKDMLLQDTNYFFSTSNRYLLGILNSKPITYYLADIQTPLGNTGAFRNYKYNIEKLPIPKINSKNQKIADELVNSVDEILKAKEEDKNANTQELENKINSLVCKLYNLTEDEIKIIEGK